MDDLTTTAQINGGYVLRYQLNELGYSDKMIKHAVREGALVRLRHGTYAVKAVWSQLSATNRHRVLTLSVLDRLGPGVVASHQSAAAIHGFDLYGVDLDTVHLTRLNGLNGRTEAGIAFHAGTIDPGRDVVEVAGRAVTSPMRSVFETCSVSGVESGMVLASAALRGEEFSKPELVEHGQRYDHWLGTRTARLAIRLADGRLESVGEVRSLHMMWRHRLPHPELQFVVEASDGRVIARTDFAWSLWRHTGEFDGLFKYGRLNPYETDPGQAIADEKIREDRVRDQQLGMSRWVWSGLAQSQQARTAGMIQRGIETSKRVYLRNGIHIPLS